MLKLCWGRSRVLPRWTKGTVIVCHGEQSTKTQGVIIYIRRAGQGNRTVHDSRARECVHRHAHKCTHTHTVSVAMVYVLRAAALLCGLAGTFVMVVLLFHIKQNATALHTAPLISASVPQPFIIASPPLLPYNVALIAVLHQAVLLRTIQASPGSG